MDRLGETNINKYGRKMKIIEYIDINNITVEFEDGYKKKGRYDRFKAGDIIHYNDKAILGVGYYGKGDFDIKDDNGKMSFLYNEWHSMLARCYNPNAQKSNKNKSYVGCSVCEEWHNFQNFAKWYTDNFYQIENERMRLDKDILVKGNKIYSPENCIIVPETINVAFTYKRDNSTLPPGISIRKESGKFRARCNIVDENGKSKTISLGSYFTIEEAFSVYKKFKEDYFKTLAERYKEYIPFKLYKALYNYKIEIDD